MQNKTANSPFAKLKANVKQWGLAGRHPTTSDGPDMADQIKTAFNLFSLSLASGDINEAVRLIDKWPAIILHENSCAITMAMQSMDEKTSMAAIFKALPRALNFISKTGGHKGERALDAKMDFVLAAADSMIGRDGFNAADQAFAIGCACEIAGMTGIDENLQFQGQFAKHLLSLSAKTISHEILESAISMTDEALTTESSRAWTVAKAVSDAIETWAWAAAQSELHGIKGGAGVNEKLAKFINTAVSKHHDIFEIMETSSGRDSDEPFYKAPYCLWGLFRLHSREWPDDEKLIQLASLLNERPRDALLDAFVSADKARNRGQFMSKMNEERHALIRVSITKLQAMTESLKIDETIPLATKTKPIKKSV